MEKEILIEDITVEWKRGIIRGFRSRQAAERFIERVCKKVAPNFDYYIYKHMISSTSKKDNR